MRSHEASAATIIFSLALAAACTSITAEDERRLAALRGSHGKAYEFRPNDIYLEVRTREAAPPLEHAGEEICREFWARPDGKPRSDSALIYMNVYSSTREWLGQFHLNTDGKVSFERLREHY
jgi:hypothetical protein